MLTLVVRRTGDDLPLRLGVSACQRHGDQGKKGRRGSILGVLVLYLKASPTAGLSCLVWEA